MNLNKFKQYLPKGAVPKKSKADKEEEKRLQALVKEVIYPIFLKNAKNIRDARNICKNFTMAFDSAFYQAMQKEQQRLSLAPFSELNLEASINKGKENTTEWLLVQNLKDEKAATVKGLIEGLGQEIQRLTEKDIIDKPLSELKTEFL